MAIGFDCCVTINSVDAKNYEKISLVSAFVRSWSKVRIELLFLDLLIGIGTNVSDNQRLLDRVVKTKVITEPNSNWSPRDMKTLNVFKWGLTSIAGLFLVFWLINMTLMYIDQFAGLT